MMRWVCPTLYFNCTIQELKPRSSQRKSALERYFNCTIQELKPFLCPDENYFSLLFQLHHTGIKTGRRKGCGR